MDIHTLTEIQLCDAANLVGGFPDNGDGGPIVVMESDGPRVTVAFAFPDFPTGDESDILGGAALRFAADIDPAEVGPRYWRESLALSALSSDMRDLAEAIMAGKRIDDDTAVDDAANHIINGREAEARTALAKWIDHE